MSDDNNGLDRARISRRVGNKWLTDTLSQPSSLGWALFCGVVAGLVFPATLLLSLPVLIFWTMVSAPADQWQMPMRMPTDMNRDDPSTARQVQGRLLGFLPVATRRIHTERASGILFAGYERGKDFARELWLTMSDLCGHVLMLATTGGGKTEMLLGWVFNGLCWGKGLIFSDHKAQNDLPLAVFSLARRFGREDDLLAINYINGGRSNAQELLEDTKGRPQTNTVNAFGLAQESYIINLMDSMMPKTGNGDGGWQEKAKAMNQALIYALVYKCRREGTVMSQRTIQAHLPLRKIAALYVEAIEKQWHPDIARVLENYLSTLAGFDMEKVATPSEWDPEANRQHGFLMQQFTRMLSLFSDTYGHVFAQDAGDIDLYDVILNDRILVMLVPALELSSNESATLGRLYQSQMAMIISQELGEKIEGRPKDNMKVRKFKGQFPFLWIIDEVGAGYSEKLGELATQIRALLFCLVLAGQDIQRLKSAAGESVWTLLANMGLRFTGKIKDTKDSLEILQSMAGTEYQPQMDTMVHQAGLMGGTFTDDNRVHLREQKKVTAQEVQALKEGETISLFNGKLVRGNSLYIKDADKLTSEKLRINRFMEVSAPPDAALLATAPYRQRRSFVRAEKVKHILKVLNAAPGRKDTSGLVLTDPALAAACRFDLECSLLWQRPPSAAVRTSILWNMVLSSLPKRGRGYLVRLRVPQLIQVAPDAIERAKQHYVPLSSEEDFQDDFSYRY